MGAPPRPRFAAARAAAYLADLFRTGLFRASLFLAALLIAAATLCGGCSRSDATTTAVPAAMHAPLSFGVTYSADLDRDGLPERVLVDKPGGRLTITDGSVVYHSREKWHVVSAALGDTDGDGYPEVVTLLDDEEGRHIGLFAYFGGKYRERLVTSELTPRILSLEVVDHPGGDYLLYTTEPPAGENTPLQGYYRWNGFGFTAVPK